jgi:hypothetical protein
VIKLKQEARRAEFGGYLQCPANSDDMTEFAFRPGDEGTMRNAASLVLNDTCFDELGAKPDGAVRFGYAWIAGPPAVPAGVAGALGLGTNDYDHYFVAHAISDLDGDGTPVVFEVSNFTRNIFVMYKNGQALAQGWE